MDNNTSLINRFFRRELLFLLIFNIMLYSLGVGISHYLGYTISWSAYITGQGITLILLLGGYFLKDYFDMLSPVDPGTFPKSQNEADAFRRLQASILITAIAVFTVAALLCVYLYRDGMMNGVSIAFLTIGAIFLVAYAVPPFRLAYSGIGELVISILMTIIVPAFSFSLQAREMNKFVSLSTLPLASFFLSMIVVHQFTTYASDCKNCRNILLVRLGWLRGWHLHNILLILGYIFLILARLLGLSWAIVWPAMLPMPIAIFQVILMNQVVSGMKPKWGLLKATSLAIVLLTTYLLAFTYWTR